MVETHVPPASARRGSERTPSFIEQARRRQIVDAAIAVLAESGYAAATFARIAERAGISPSLISYHFERKQDLLAEVLDAVIAVMDATLTADVEGATSYPIALRRLIESSVRFFASRTPALLALEQLFGQALDPAVAAAAARHREATLRELEDVFVAGQGEKELGDFAARPMAVTLQAALEAVPTELRNRPDTDVEAYATALADIFEAATAPRPAAAPAVRPIA